MHPGTDPAKDQFSEQNIFIFHDEHVHFEGSLILHRSQTQAGGSAPPAPKLSLCSTTNVCLALCLTSLSRFPTPGNSPPST